MTANPAQTPAQKAARRAVKGVGPDTDIAGNPLTDEQKATMREIEARWSREDAMTANPFAALLRDVPVYNWPDFDDPDPDGAGNWIYRGDLLAALAAAVPDDLAEAGKVVEAAQRVSDILSDLAEFDGDRRGMWEAMDDAEKVFAGKAPETVKLITALLARITAQEARIKGLVEANRELNMQSIADLGQAQEAYEAQKAAEAEVSRLRDRLARMEGALPSDQAISDLAYLMWSIHPNEIAEQGYTHISHGGKYQNPRQAWYCDHIKALIAPARAAITEAGK